MEIKSRVPGKIVRFEKQVGDTVAVRDVLIVMEAMKMKQLVPSPVAGVVKEYKVQPGGIIFFIPAGFFRRVFSFFYEAKAWKMTAEKAQNC